MSIADKNQMNIRPRMDVFAALAVPDTNGTDVDFTFTNPTAGTTSVFSWPTSKPTSYCFGYPITTYGGMYQSWNNFNVAFEETDGDEIQLVLLICDPVGYWTVKHDNGPSKQVRPVMLFNVSDNVGTLKFERNGSGNLKIWAIVPCTSDTLAFDNSNLTQIDLNLAGSLDVFNPTYEVSTIDIDAYTPGLDLLKLSVLPDKTPIVYMSGYAGDEMSFPRFFYLSEPPGYEKNLLSVSGEDSSAALESYQVPAEVVTFGTGNGLSVYYDHVKAVLAGAGIDLVDVQRNPTTYTGTTGNRAIIKAQTGREFIADMMATCQYYIDDTIVEHTFRPTFIDAGRPVLRWMYSDPDTPEFGPYDIYEADIGEHKREIDQAVKTIKTDDAYGLYATIYDHSASTATIATVAVNSGRAYTQSWQSYYRGVAITRSTTPKTITATSASWKAASTGNSVISGFLQDVDVTTSSVSNDRVARGREVVLTPKIYGRFSQTIDDTTRLGAVPLYGEMFKQNVERGSFEWKGDPNMQPRDSFWFHYSDGTYEAYTIERIELTHEGGGTSAVIHYRKGVY